MDKKAYLSGLKDAWDIVQLKKNKFEEVYRSSSDLWCAVLILVLPPFVNLFLSSLLFPNGFRSLFSAVAFWPMIIPLISLVGSIFLFYYVLEKWFQFKVDLKGLFKVLAYGSLLLWASIIPFLLDLFGLFSVSVLFGAVWMLGIVWFFVVAYNFLNIHIKPSQRDLMISMLVIIIGYFLIQQILGKLLVGSYYRMFY